MNAPWWRIKTDQQSTDGAQGKAKPKDRDDDLLPPFVD
jgi:hypothetical protein